MNPVRYYRMDGLTECFECGVHVISTSTHDALHDRLDRLTAVPDGSLVERTADPPCPFPMGAKVRHVRSGETGVVTALDPSARCVKIDGGSYWPLGEDWKLVPEVTEPPAWTPVWWDGEWWVKAPGAGYYRRLHGATGCLLWSEMPGAVQAASPEESA